MKQMYRTVMDDHFPDEMTSASATRRWCTASAPGSCPTHGRAGGEGPALRGEPGPGGRALRAGGRQPRASAGAAFIDPGSGLVSALTEEHMLQAGKHPGKTNLTDVDNGLNILKYLMDRPTAVILKHNNPCGAAEAGTLAAGLRQGQPGRPHRRLRGRPGREPCPGPGHRRGGGRELPGGGGRPGLRGGHPGDPQAHARTCASFRSPASTAWPSTGRKRFVDFKSPDRTAASSCSSPPSTP